MKDEPARKIFELLASEEENTASTDCEPPERQSGAANYWLVSLISIRRFF